MNKYKLCEKVIVLSILGIFIGTGIINNVSGKTFSNLNPIYVDDDNIYGPWDGTQDYPFQYIQDALDALLYTGGDIRVEDGVYRENLIIKTSDIYLLGEGDNVKIIGTLGDVITINNGLNRIYIDSLILQSDYKNHKNAGIYVGVECEDIGIYRNKISDCMYGIWLDRKSTGITISSNEIYNIDYYGVYVQMESDYNMIRDNHISSCDEGIHIEDCYSFTIYNNVIEKNNVGIYFGVGIENKIEANIIKNNSRYGLWLANMWDNVISGNSFSDNGGGNEMMFNAFFIDSRNHWKRNTGLFIIFGLWEFGLPTKLPTFQIDFW